MNEALAENVFVGLLCIMNRIPLFIVGKPGHTHPFAPGICSVCTLTIKRLPHSATLPGTSKTLCMQVLCLGFPIQVTFNIKRSRCRIAVCPCWSVETCARQGTGGLLQYLQCRRKPKPPVQDVPRACKTLGKRSATELMAQTRQGMQGP